MYLLQCVLENGAHLSGDLLLSYNFMHKVEIHQPNRDTPAVDLAPDDQTWHSFFAIRIDDTKQKIPWYQVPRPSLERPRPLHLPALSPQISHFSLSDSMVPVRVTSADGTALVNTDCNCGKGLTVLHSIYEIIFFVYRLCMDSCKSKWIRLQKDHTTFANPHGHFAFTRQPLVLGACQSPFQDWYH